MPIRVANTKQKPKTKGKKVVEPQTPAEVKRERLKNLETAVEKINKALNGNGEVYLGSNHKDVRRLPSGVLTLDLLTGGGYPRGHLVEMFGPESAGKSLSTLIAIATTQDAGGIAGGIFREGFDPIWARKRGVKTDDLFLVEASEGDTTLEAGLTLLDTGALDLFVIDSFQALGTSRESKDGVDSEAYGAAGAPQMWGRVMRRAYQAAKLGQTAILGISQVRANIGKSFGGEFSDGSNIRAIRHWKSIALEFTRGAPWFSQRSKEGRPEGRKIVAHTYKVRCTKNKTAGTIGRTGEFRFGYVKEPVMGYTGGDEPEEALIVPGVDRADELFRLALTVNKIEMKGSFYSMGGKTLGQGKKNVLAMLRNDEKLASEVEKEVRRVFKETW